VCRFNHVEGLQLNLYIAKMGTQVIVPYRDEDEVRRLKLMGDLGKVVKMVILPLLEQDVPVV
jgi:hypothetical protein